MINIHVKTYTNSQEQTYTKITDATSLGLAMLTAEDEEGRYEPVSVVGSLDEAREAADDDMRSRMRRLEKGETLLCPFVYKVWARRMDGYQVVAELKDLI